MKHKLHVGDRVKLTGKFLKNTGQTLGHAGMDTWIIMGFWGSDDRMVYVNEPIDPNNPLYADLSDADRPKWRTIAAGNLYKVGSLTVRNDP